MSKKSVLKATSNSELLSYIINVTPELKSEIDLPVQGESIVPIGKIIINNERYKNAFINTVNLIGLTVIKRNQWNDPWDFTNRGILNFGQQVREIVLDLANVYDYNENFENKTKFLETEVPNVYNYIHEINFQKYYHTTTSDEQLAMAFNSEGGLLDFITEAIQMNYESLTYDTYQVNKYMLARRILDGTITPVQIADYGSLTPRQRVSAIKDISNKMSFRSPNYNPAGIRRATSFDNQIAIVNTEFEADFSTDVLATSFFRDEADMKARMRLIDGFDNLDDERLAEVLGSAYTPLTDGEKSTLANIPCMIISDEWFMDYDYSLNAEAPTKATEFYNPTTLENHHYLHAWKVFSTSPFENAVLFTSDTPSVTAVEVSPASASVSAGQQIQLSAVVTATGGANKAVVWSVTSAEGESETNPVSVNGNGLVTIPSDYSGDPIVITATSVYDSSVSDTAEITVL
jgi:hypothetical protein